MMAGVLRAGTMLLVLTTAACGGSGDAPAHFAKGTASMSCQADMPFTGTTPHAALPTTLFPTVANGGAVDAPLPAELGGLLDEQVADLLRKTGAPAMSAAVTVQGLGRWSSTQGLAQTVPGQFVDAGSEFYWGSVAKALTAVLVLQLVDEGKLRLDDTLSHRYPQVPTGTRRHRWPSVTPLPNF